MVSSIKDWPWRSGRDQVARLDSRELLVVDLSRRVRGLDDRVSDDDGEKA